MAEGEDDNGRIINVRLARIEDVDAIAAINRSWIAIGNDPAADRSKGHLFGRAFTIDQLELIVANQGIAVFTVDDAIGGYFLFDHWTDNETTADYREQLERLGDAGLLPSGAMCARAQVAIHADNQSLGMYGPLQDCLCNHFSDRFDWVFSLVAKNNSKRSIHARYGWRIISENDEVAFVVRPLVQSA